jgi:Exostosin family
MFFFRRRRRHHRHNHHKYNAMICNTKDGQNHMIWMDSPLFDMHGDRPNPHHFNYEFAALALWGFNDAIIRPGYDISMQLPQKWQRAESTMHLELHRPRRLLVSFKGNVENWDMPYYQHRWLALEYWDTDEDIFVDSRCSYDLSHQNYDFSSDFTTYGELLLNSTFVFCPGGGGPNSYRFQEALAADAIPIVVSYVTLPYTPEVDWSGCVVKVSEARVADIPRIVRQMPATEIEARRERCQTMYRGLLGRKQNRTSQDEHTLLVALKIWRQRILQAHYRQQLFVEVEELIVHLSKDKKNFRGPFH